MKKITFEPITIKDDPKPRSKSQTLKDKIIEYIKQHPNCRTTDLFYLSNEGNIRRQIRELVNVKLIKKRNCECGITYFLEVFLK